MPHFSIEQKTMSYTRDYSNTIRSFCGVNDASFVVGTAVIFIGRLSGVGRHPRQLTSNCEGLTPSPGACSLFPTHSINSITQYSQSTLHSNPPEHIRTETARYAEKVNVD